MRLNQYVQFNALLFFFVCCFYKESSFVHLKSQCIHILPFYCFYQKPMSVKVMIPSEIHLGLEIFKTKFSLMF